MSTSRITTAVLAAAAAVTASVVLQPSPATSSPGGLDGVKAATAKYHSLQQAAADGFSAHHEPCVSSPAGAMGVHHVHPARVVDASLDPRTPEALLYVPDSRGASTLAGVEYIYADDDQDLTTDADRPTLFGQPFDGPMPGHGPNMPVHYDLHVWLWSDNPSGVFAPFNPSLSCP